MRNTRAGYTSGTHPRLAVGIAGKEGIISYAGASARSNHRSNSVCSCSSVIGKCRQLLGLMRLCLVVLSRLVSSTTEPGASDLKYTKTFTDPKLSQQLSRFFEFSTYSRT